MNAQHEAEIGDELATWGGPRYLNEYSRQVCAQQAFDAKLRQVEKEQYRQLSNAIVRGESGDEVEAMRWSFDAEMGVLRRMRPKVTAQPAPMSDPSVQFCERERVLAGRGYRSGPLSDG